MIVVSCSFVLSQSCSFAKFKGSRFCAFLKKPSYLQVLIDSRLPPFWALFGEKSKTHPFRQQRNLMCCVFKISGLKVLEFEEKHVMQLNIFREKQMFGPFW